jgi:hypothetical protein
MRIFLLSISLPLLMVAAAPPAAKYDSKRDLQGVWEAHSTAAFGLEAHSAAEGIRAGDTVIVDPPDGKIPYKPEALATRAENFRKRATADPVNKCYLPGVPRITYMPFPFQIFQTPEFVAITYEYVHASRTVHLTNPKHLDDISFWMGDSRGHWEGDTLVVDVADNEPTTWLDLSGDFHSDALHIVERYTRTSPDTMLYEATIEDPNVYTRPWKISIPLYRHTEKNAQLYEYECHVYRDGGSGFQAGAGAGSGKDAK